MPSPRALTIAGSDPSGGAGIQADLKTFLAHGVYGMSAIAALTVQNTRGVVSARAVAPDLVVGQIQAVLEDIGADAIKTGMLANGPIIDAVAECLGGRANRAPLVVDPVMTAKNGARLLDEGAEESLKRRLLPIATLVTPNASEAAILAGFAVRTRSDAMRAAEAIAAFGCQSVLVKGGHLEGAGASDFYWAAEGSCWISGERLESQSLHGTGCTLSAAIAAGLARGLDLLEACRRAKEYVAGAIRHAESLGHGIGPLNHAWRIRGQ